LALCQVVGIEAPELEAIVHDRDAWLKCACCHKDMVSKVMNGYSQDMDQWQASLHALRSEMRSLDRALFASELSAPIRAVLGECASVEEVRRTAVDTLEDCALSVVVETFEGAGSLCVGRIYDGAHQLKHDIDMRPLDLAAIAIEASAAVKHTLGLSGYCYVDA